MKKLKFVVVVDTDSAIRDSLRFSLEVEGFAVCEYPVGVDLLKDVERTAVDCLVLDEQISGMSGLDAIARLRERNIDEVAQMALEEEVLLLHVMERAPKIGNEVSGGEVAPPTFERAKSWYATSMRSSSDQVSAD